eukprot:TRINITY_DN1074_c0_g2_i1.p1 TRINITY_DN1074_c0_g2~~TRINITY_DN1074_c0_g2_i1.p1  ORF type:complete len:393 (-),score=120.26 TRINITY_DN1074_c0_g2_i1:31-1209(-)
MDVKHKKKKQIKKVFKGLRINLELGATNDKKKVSKILKASESELTYLVTKKTDYMVTTKYIFQQNGAKISKALEYSIPIVKAEYIYDCEKEGKLLEAIPYLLSNATNFKLKVPKLDNMTKTKDGESDISFNKLPVRKIKQKKKVIVPPVIATFNYLTEDDKSFFPFKMEEYEIIRSDILTLKPKSNEPTKFYELELHYAKNKDKDDKYRIFTHNGILEDPESGEKECRYTDDVDMAEGIYSRLYNSKSEMDYETIQLIKSNIGSELARNGGLQAIGSANSSQDLPKEIDSLIKYIFYEAAAFLKNSSLEGIVSPEGLIKTPLGTLSLSQIEKAEVVLLRLYKIFQDSTCTKEDLILISNEFYSAMPQKSTPPIDNLDLFTEKYELIQLLKDL